MKLLRIFFLLSFSLCLGQSTHILKSNGEIINLKNRISKNSLTGKVSKILLNKSVDKNRDNEITGTLDTLNYSYYGNLNSNFGFNSQDMLIQYFAAPADMIIKAVGFSCSDDSGAINGSDISVRLIKLNWDEALLNSITNDVYLGYYTKDDSIVKADYFGENSSGNWIDSTNGLYPLPPWTNNINPSLNSFEYDIWSDSAKGVNITPIEQSSAGKYQWINTSVLDFEPTVMAGSLIAVVVKHNGNSFENDRIGFHAGIGVGYPGFKFYAKGRSDTTNIGWWIRPYTFDFSLAIDLVGGPYYRFNFVTDLKTTLSSEPRIVEAEIWGDNPNPNVKVFSEINLYYSIDEQNFTKVLMDSISMYRYSGEIPGQNPNTNVTYFCEAVDWEGHKWQSPRYSYKVFKPTDDVNTLLVFNGLPEAGYPSSYYFGQDDFIDNIPINFPHDIWAFGEFDSSLINNYQNMFEITTNGPNFYHRNIIRKWLEEDGTRNYFLAGDDWLGTENGFTDTNFLPGSFEYDILGITRSYNDVSYDGTNGEDLPSKLIPIQNSFLGGALYNLFNENGPTDSLRYDPIYENGNINNWIDAFEVVDSNNIDLFVETRGIETQPSVKIKPCAVHNITPNGNKIVFLSYDPISINSAPDYYWYGFSETSLQVQTLKWFGIITDLQDEEQIRIPIKFELYQNYPNPFNPTTKIKYSIPAVIARSEATWQSDEILSENSFARNDNMNVSLKVYDILGREIKTLVNEKQKPGTYEIEFNGTNLTSGVYFYKLSFGEYIKSRKMLLLK